MKGEVSVRQEEDFPLSCSCGRVWPSFIYVRPSVAFKLCMGLFWPLLFLSGLAVGGFESLPLCGFYIYNRCLFEILCFECV